MTWLTVFSPLIGVNSFRVTQEYKDIYMLDDGELLHVFKKVKDLRALAQCLSENGHIIDKVSNRVLRNYVPRTPNL